MKFLASFAGLLAILSLGLNCLQADPASDEAIAASTNTVSAWLPLIDVGEYANSYDGFCVMAKTSLTKETWIKKSEQVRAPLGTLISRTLSSAQFLNGLPNGTAGKFVMLQYTTDFQKFNATETVTTAQDKDGVWRIAGYFIRPRS